MSYQPFPATAEEFEELEKTSIVPRKSRKNQVQVWHPVELRFLGETDLLFTFDHTPFERGGRDTYGQATEPDYPARMEFVDATDEDGKEIIVATPDIDAAREKAFAEVDEENLDWSLE
jgi:hypothetical protein